MEEIQTRQKADVLWSTTTPLGAGGFYNSPIRRVAGYAELEIFAVSDQPFAIQVEEATDVRILPDGTVTGNFVQTEATMVAVAVGSQWLVCERINPCGNFARMVLGNLGGTMMGELAFVVQGLPLP